MQVTFKEKQYEVKCYDEDFNDYVSSFIFKGHFYEEPLLTFLNDNYKPKKVLDIGANIGNHSVFFSKVMNAKVTSFEPVKENFNILKKNNPNSLNIGLGDCEKKMGYITGSFGSMVNMGGCELVDGDYIKVKTLDSLNLDADFIKIDAENMEAEIVAGGIETIKRNKPVLVIEHNDIQHLYDTARLLVPLGYIIKPFTQKGWEIFIYEIPNNSNLATK